MTGVLDFYLLDAHEQPKTDLGHCMLIGKIANADKPGHWKSCCILVQCVEQRVYVKLRPGVSMEAFGKHLADLRQQQGFSTSKFRAVRRRRIDPDQTNPALLGLEEDYVEVLYPIKSERKQLRVKPDANTVELVVETQASPVERLLLDLGVRGPTWMHIQHAVVSRRAMSYCAATYEISGLDCISLVNAPAPPLQIMSLHATFEDCQPDGPKDVAHRLCSFSCIVHDRVTAAACDERVFSRAGSQTLRGYHYTRLDQAQAVASLGEAAGFPAVHCHVYANQEAVAAAATEAGGAGGKWCSVHTVSSQEDLYSALEQLFRDEDPDAVVSHNSLRYTIPRLLTEMQRRSRLKQYSFLGRIRTTDIYYLRSERNAADYENPNHSWMQLDGRLHFDTHLLSGSFVASRHARSIRSDSLQEYLEAHDVQPGHTRYWPVHLYPDTDALSPESVERLLEVQGEPGDSRISTAMRLHGSDTYTDLFAHEVPGYLAGGGDMLQQYIINHLNGAYKQLQLLYKLNLVPFTLEVSHMCGNLWRENLSSRNVNRIEYLLMHALATDNYIVERAAPPQRTAKRGGSAASSAQKSSDSGPGYEGGRILEVVPGEYNGYSCLIDARSMYASIIQHGTVCVTNPRNLDVSFLACNQLVLPRIIRDVCTRRAEYAAKKLVLDQTSSEFYSAKIGEEALKLIANQCYGCLGSEYFRFRNKNAGAEITRQGRAVLEGYISVLECDARFTRAVRVLYGHTDSLMVHVVDGSCTFAESNALFTSIADALNRAEGASGVQVKIDAVFRRVVIYTRTQYAGLQIRDPAAYGPDRAGQRGAYDLYVRGCELANRQLPPLAQQLCANVLCEALLRGVVEAPDFQDRLQAYARRIDSAMFGSDGEQRQAWNSALTRRNGAADLSPGALTHILSGLVCTTVLNAIKETSNTPQLGAIRSLQPPHLQQRFLRRGAPVQIVYAKPADGPGFTRGHLLEQVHCLSLPGYTGTDTRLVADLRYTWNVHVGTLLQKSFDIIEGINVQQLAGWFGIDYSAAAAAKGNASNEGGAGAGKISSSGSGNSGGGGGGAKHGRAAVHDFFRAQHGQVLKFCAQTYSNVAETVQPRRLPQPQPSALSMAGIPILPAAYDLMQLQMHESSIQPLYVLCKSCELLVANGEKTGAMVKPYIPFVDGAQHEGDGDSEEGGLQASRLFATHTFVQSTLNDLCCACEQKLGNDAEARIRTALARTGSVQAQPEHRAVLELESGVVHRQSTQPAGNAAPGRVGLYTAPPTGPPEPCDISPAKKRGYPAYDEGLVMNGRYRRWLLRDETAEELLAKCVCVAEVPGILAKRAKRGSLLFPMPGLPSDVDARTSGFLC